MDVDVNQTNKRVVLDFWSSLDELAAEQDPSAIAAAVRWFGFDPIGNLAGSGSFFDDFWFPFRKSFPVINRDTHIFFAGESNGRVDGDITKDGHQWVSGTGLISGKFEHDYLGIPANGE
ncbi:MAG: hypothetical protein AAF662_11215, partial [Pseudomonadota bacterium]